MAKKQKSVKSKRIPVLVENATYGRLQAFSKATGISGSHVVNEALNDWLDTVGAARLEAFRRPGREILRDNLLEMPTRAEQDLKIVN